MSFDIDWSPEYILEDFYELLRSAALPVTLFCTHRSEMVDKLLELPGCEAGLHPNLQDAEDEAAALAELHGAFQEAKGVRVHRLYYHSGLLALFHRAGLNYLSNDLEFLKEGLAPHYDWSELVRLPLYWEDDVHATLLYDSFDSRSLRLEKPGLKIFNFHPVHLYLNTGRMEDYVACKGDLHDPDRMQKRRNAGAGIRTLFEALTKAAGEHEVELLGDVADAFVSAQPRSKAHRRFMDLQERTSK